MVILKGNVPELASITLLHGVSFKNFNTSISNPIYYIHSFYENKIGELCKQGQSRQWIRYNQRYLSRTFPSGARVDSSNYNPIQAWATGCQLVALNFQTPDPSLRINDGRFRENGGCGYVLKPEYLLQEESPLQHSPRPASVTIRVLSGSCFPKPYGQVRGECIDPYVKVALFDVTENNEKSIMRKETTNFVDSNGFFPIWNSNKFSFSVQNQNVAMLQLTVWDKDTGKPDDFIASAAIPISCLRKGYRSVKLFDCHNTRSGAFGLASLLIEINIERTTLEI